MAMVGHKTESIYKRYAIVDDAMHREAAAKLDAYANGTAGRSEGQKAWAGPALHVPMIAAER
jgi:hypothetical protein